MKLTIDTARDNPRLIRAAIAMVLAALDNGDALPAVVPKGLILTENESAHNVGFGSAPPPPPVAAPDSAVVGAQQTAHVPPPASGTPQPPVSTLPAPPPAAPVTAPSVSAAPLIPASGAERDVEGLPWDSRIHSSSHAKVANGTWKLAKGMSLQAAKVESVKAELRALMAVPVPPGSVAAAPAPAIVQTAPPPPPPPAATEAAPPPPPPPPAAAAAPAGNDNPATFPEFMGWVAGLIQAGRWTHQHTAQALGAIGLNPPSAIGLGARPDLIPGAVATIKSMLGGA